MPINVECMIGRDGKLYTYVVYSDGKKKRVKNGSMGECINSRYKISGASTSDSNVLECQKRLCKAVRNKKRIYTPCRKKLGLFENRIEVEEYCNSKVRGPYKRNKRAKM